MVRPVLELALAVWFVRHDHRRRNGAAVGIEDSDHDRGDRPPTSWKPMNAAADDGAMPAKVFKNIRPNVIAGFAKLVDEVKK